MLQHNNVSYSNDDIDGKESTQYLLQSIAVIYNGWSSCSGMAESTGLYVLGPSNLCLQKYHIKMAEKLNNTATEIPTTIANKCCCHHVLHVVLQLELVPGTTIVHFISYNR